VNATDRRTRLLYLTAGFPFPLSSGYLRHFHLLRELACNHQVHLMSLTGPSFQEADIDGVRPFVDQVSTFARVPRRRGSRVGHLLAPTSPDPAAVAMARAVDGELTRGAADVVLLSGKDTAAAVAVIDGRVPLAVDLCDATSHRITQAIGLASPVRRAGLVVRRRGIRRIERELVERADALITASARDAAALREEGAPDRVLDAHVVPNGVDLAYWHRRSAVLGGAVVFCGNLGYGPNADAARVLVHDVMPRVWAEQPDAEVVIVGTGASAELTRTLERPQVTLTGHVPDVRPYLEAGVVFAAPLRMAAGIQNKLLEALAMELPVVTTSVAAAGLGRAGSALPVAVADTPADQAAAIVRQRRFAGGRPGRSEREWVADRFSWERSGAALAAILDGLHQEVEASC
jgi:glycosyltransferase involved in cell wall biosynthesis